MADEGSITRCIDLLKRGDPDAAQLVWQRYVHRLVGLARARLRAASDPSADGEDIVLSAFDSFFRRAERGQFARLEDRDDLWELLFVVTVRKAANLAKYQGRVRRGGGAVRALSDLEGPDAGGLPGPEPTPELAAQAAEQCRRLLGLLPDESLRLVARRKLEGCTNAEIAAEIGRIEATVERKLQRIRALWERALDD